MSYQVEYFFNGKNSVRNSVLGESIHSSIGPWEEANLIYVGQSRLKERLQRHEPGPLVVYDVGLGIAANALAVITATLKQQNKEISRDFHLISFENDLEGLRFTLDNHEHFPFLSPFLKENKDLVALIRKNFLPTENSNQSSLSLEYQSSSGSIQTTIKWELRVGDFLQELNKSMPAPELIYFDFYSPKSSPDLWNYETFRRLYDATAPRRQARLTSTLLTYTSSTAVRSAMILAGFKVGYGIQTPSKLETTVASTCSAELVAPLGQKWVEHLKRSSKPLPLDHKYSTESEAIAAVITMVSN